MDVERQKGRSASDVVNSLLREYGDKLDESPSQPQEHRPNRGDEGMVREGRKALPKLQASPLGQVLSTE